MGKPDCGLCREMRAIVRAVAPTFGLKVREVDVGGDPALERLYLFEIPVLLLGGREVARHQTTPEELTLRLEELLRGRA